VTDYEILLMLDPELPEERQTEIVTRAREAIERDGGSFDAHEPWGRRRLAFEIDHKGEGAYHLLTFAAEPATLEEISRVLKITDGVMRQLAVRRVLGASTRPPEPAPEERVAPAPAARQDAEAEAVPAEPEAAPAETEAEAVPAENEVPPAETETTADSPA
jgi:small subunit ribosomal protein S6